ncbi:MAG: radical SAM protein [Myxococcota bacterium]
MDDARLTALTETIDGGGSVTLDDAGWLFREAPDAALRDLASRVRRRYHPDGRATYLVMAIVNTTNVCVARCDYCSFYRLPKHPDTYLLTADQICARIDALRVLGGTMVGFNGGFHPKLRIPDYARLFAEVRARNPDLAFYEMTVAEFVYACKVSRMTYAEGAAILADHGTQWVTGGGARVMAESFRARHSPLKYTVAEYYVAQRAILEAGLGSTATMVIGFDETLEERLEHLAGLRAFQRSVGGALPSFLCWTYKPYHNALGGTEIGTDEYLRWLAVCRIFLDGIEHVRTSVLTQNERALEGLLYGADDFDLPTEDEVTTSAGATIHHDFERILGHARRLGIEPVKRAPFPVPARIRPLSGGEPQPGL